MSENKKRAVLYCRVSTKDQNCDRQLKDLKAFAERSDYEVIETFKETASGTKNDRKERARVIALAQKREIDVVLCTEMSRFGRSLQDLLSTLHELKAFKVSLICQTGFQFDLSTPQGKMLAGILGSLAEFERDLLTERINSGLAAAKKRGIVGGRPKGHKRAAELRSKILQLKDDGLNYEQIAKKLHCSKDVVGEALKLPAE